LSRRRFLLSGLGAALAARCGGENESPVDATPPPSTGGASGPPIVGESLSGRQVFPAGNWWNLDIFRAPVDRDSAAFIDWIGQDRGLHPDFGPSPYGIPYVTVSRTQPRVPVRFVDYPDESDAGAPNRPPGYPIPTEARTQTGFLEGGSDRHLLLIDRDEWLLFETWATRWNGDAGVWEAGSGAVFDMSRSDRRPEGWTSADAAGLAIFPGLVRRDEVDGGEEIRHAFRVTVRATNGSVWPASHEAGGASGALPMGARLRLRSSKDLSGYPAHLQRVFRAMQTHGLIVADNGSDLFVTGTMDSSWNNDELNPGFRSLRAQDFEVIELGFR
jgi:hypothetical protein